MSLSPEPLPPQEELAEKLLTYISDLHLRLSSIAKRISPAFNTEVITVSTSRSLSNSVSRDLVSVYNSSLAFGIMPDGGQGRYFYFVNKANTHSISVLRIKDDIVPYLFEPGIDLANLKNMSVKLINYEAAPLHLLEKLVNPITPFNRTYHVMVNTPGHNIWGKPLGEGPILFQ